jgi:hypothetical protein
MLTRCRQYPTCRCLRPSGIAHRRVGEFLSVRSRCVLTVRFTDRDFLRKSTAGTSGKYGLPLIVFVALLATAVGSLAQGSTLALCRFDLHTLAFAGTAREQAHCLLRPVAKWGKVGAILPSLPPTLEARVGNSVELSRDELRRELRTLNLTETAVGGSLDEPISRGSNGATQAPVARYFVIHDTSWPWLDDRPFPSDIDTGKAVNDLHDYAGPNAGAHMFIDRRGEMLVGHEFSVPWRATKTETRIIGDPARGLFIHIELVQPRRRDPRAGPRNYAVAPEPGFTPAQYDRLALLYVVASVRAGEWMVPAFHAVIDARLPDAHDDPQNFDLTRFDAALGRLLGAMDHGRN